jgi:hypothetical protein
MQWAHDFAMRKIGLLKRAGAIILLLSLFLPMHSCTSFPTKSTPAETAKSSEVARPRYFYAWTAEDAKDPSSYLVLLAFIWPAVAVCLGRIQVRRRYWRIALSLLEAALSIGTAWIIYGLGWAIGRAEAGAYMAVSGFALYLLARSIEIIQRYGGLIR